MRIRSDMVQTTKVSGRGAIVAVGAPKGGVAKSSLAWEVAQGFARVGTRVALIDGDETATVATMYDNRQAGPLADKGAVVSVAPDHIERLVIETAKGFDLVVVDLGARDWKRYTTLPLASDLWIMPTDFSTASMTPAARLFAETLWPANGRHFSHGPVPVRLAWCRTPTHTGNAASLERCLAWWADAVESITGLKPRAGQRFHPGTGFDVFESQLRFRSSAWEEAAVRGAALAELPHSVGGKAAAEVEQLLVEIQHALQPGKGKR